MAYIYVAWQANQLSSVAGWAKLGLSPSSDLRHTNAAPKPLGRHQQTCLIQSAPERWLPFIFISKPPGIQVLCIQFLTRCQFDLKGRANQGHQCGGEVYCIVICNGHVHLHQALIWMKAKRTGPWTRNNISVAQGKEAWDMTVFTSQGSKCN